MKSYSLGIKKYLSALSEDFYTNNLGMAEIKKSFKSLKLSHNKKYGVIVEGLTYMQLKVYKAKAYYHTTKSNKTFNYTVLKTMQGYDNILEHLEGSKNE